MPEKSEDAKTHLRVVYVFFGQLKSTEAGGFKVEMFEYGFYRLTIYAFIFKNN